jgi:soluble lytic murein transglycosylase-like protein
MSRRFLPWLRVVVVVAIPGPATGALADPYGALVQADTRPSALGALLSYRLMARREAAGAGLPFDLVDAVMKIESDYRPDRIGDVGEIGLMQVRPGTAALLGFRGGPADLADPAVNIHFGATYLGQAWRLARGNVCRTLMKYRAGHGEEAMSPLSASYCARARAHLVAMGSPLVASIKAEDLAAASAFDTPTARPAGAARRGFWGTFEARIKRINARIEARWRHASAR